MALGQSAEDLDLSVRENDSRTATGPDIQLFVELPPKDLICTKCEKVLREPHQAECGHLYCARCVFTTEDSSCHCCGRNLRSQSRAYSKDYQRDRSILELRVRCPERGCQWEGELQHLETHCKEECAYKVVECEFRYAGCMARGTAREMREHMEVNTQQHLNFVVKHFQAQLDHKGGSVTVTANTLQKKIWEGETHQQEHGAGDMNQRKGCSVAKPCAKFCGFLIRSAVLVLILAVLMLAVLIMLAMLCQYYDRSVLPKACPCITPPLDIAVPISLHESTALYGGEWQSVPFYSHQGGYKMRIVILKPGLCYKSTCLLWGDMFGFYLLIEPGEFDNCLRWPPDVKMTVQLLHPGGDYQPEKSISPILLPNELSRWHNYISLEEVERYITNNTLSFRVTNGAWQRLLH